MSQWVAQLYSDSLPEQLAAAETLNSYAQQSDANSLHLVSAGGVGSFAELLLTSSSAAAAAAATAAAIGAKSSTSTSSSTLLQSAAAQALGMLMRKDPFLLPGCAVSRCGACPGQSGVV